MNVHRRYVNKQKKEKKKGMSLGVVFPSQAPHNKQAAKVFTKGQNETAVY